jgi:hypothetical protein
VWLPGVEKAAGFILTAIVRNECAHEYFLPLTEPFF